MKFRKIFDELANVGATEHGRDCLAYSANEDLAHNKAVNLLKKLGCEIEVDLAKNLYATWYPNGVSHKQPAIAIGSHLDSVPRGGRFDGVLGVAVGIEVLRRIQKIKISRPIRVVAFRAEESSRFKQGLLGSSIAAGILSAKQIASLKDESGTTFLEVLGLTKTGIKKLINERKINKKNLAAYFELHIEQSSVLESINEQSDRPAIGIVTGGIGGSYRARITLTGRSFHSGGLPMKLRNKRDMAVVAAEIILAVRRLAEKLDTQKQPFRATVNIENISGKAVNAGSGKESLLLDARGIHPKKFLENIKKIKFLVKQISKRYELKLDFTELSFSSPTPFGTELPKLLISAAKKTGTSFIELPSMPGHDAASVAKAGVSVGMIFVESRGGESHNKTEYTSFKQIELGIKVLTQALVALANR